MLSRNPAGNYYCGRLIGTNIDNSKVYCGKGDAQCDDCERYQLQNDPRRRAQQQQLVDPMQSLLTLMMNTSIGDNTGGQGGRYSCNSCRGTITNGLRYHCEVCDDFDLCEVCFSGKDAPDDHSIDHRMTAINTNDQSIYFRCDSCGVSINGLRWRCTICPSLDICGSCHNRSKWPSHHLATHPEITYQDFLKDTKTMVVNMSFTCDVCHSDIYGLRIHCNNCPNFDICEKCHRKGKIVAPHSTKHSVLAFREPGSILIPEYCSSPKKNATVGVNPDVELVSLSSWSGLYGTTKDLFMTTWKKDLHLKPKLQIKAVCRVENTILKASYRIYKKKN